MALYLRYFRNPCDRDPPTGNFKTFKFFKNVLKILNVYFWGTSVYFWGMDVHFWGTFTFGDNRVFGFFGISFFVAGAFGAPWVGGPRRGFRKYLICTCPQLNLRLFQEIRAFDCFLGSERSQTLTHT